MTCIVGVIHKNKVWIGGDSAGVSGLDVSVRKDQKVFHNGEFIIGGTSSFRMLQLLRYVFKPPKVEGEIFAYMVTKFVPALRKCFKENGFGGDDDDGDTGGTFLVGYQNRLFCIESDYQVEETEDMFHSVGCGEPYAKGALLNMKKSLSPQKRLTKALETATYFSAGVRPPYYIIHT